MRKHNTLQRIAFPFIIALALLLAACGGNNDQTGETRHDQIPTATVTGGTTPSSAPSAAPGGGTIKVKPTIVPSGSEPVCRLDKIGTWSEVAGAGPQRIEFGGGEASHYDLYPDRGVPSVSFIAPAMNTVIVHGFGSSWYANSSVVCSQFDWISDTTRYARDRAGNGHSGLVVDLRGGKFNVVANLAKPQLTAQQIIDLLAKFNITQDQITGLPTGSAVPSASPGASAAASAAPTAGCPTAKDQNVISPTDVTVKGPAVVHPWWNNGKPSFAQTQVRVKLESGQSATFIAMMGHVYTYEDTAACKANLDNEFKVASFPAKTLDELKAEKNGELVK